MFKNVKKMTLAVGALLLFRAIYIKAEDTIQTLHDAGPIVSGEPTNNIRGSVLISYDQNLNVWITVYAQRSGQVLTNEFPGTNFASDIYQYMPVYLGATNFFCGLVELEDAFGKRLPPLKPELASAESYPNRLSWLYLYRLHQPSYRAATDYLMLDFLHDTYRYRIERFNLNNLFSLKEGGEYKLTIWPKIYKHSETNRDLYQRLDIPPVSVPVRWHEQLSK